LSQFKVIQGDRFGFYSKADSLLVNNTNLDAILHRFDRGYVSLTDFFGMNP